MGVALLFIGGCKNTTAETESGSAVKAVVSVRTAPVIRGTVRVDVEATGKTDALRQAEISSPIAGTITSLKVLDGESVTAGDVLAVVQSREVQAALEGARALLARARTDADRAEALRTLALAESTQTQVQIRAPFSGVISSRTAAVGQVIAENAPFLTLVDLATMDFLADVPLKDLASIKSGQECEIRLDALPETRLAATVDAINPATESESQSVKVRMGFLSDNTSYLKTGMAGTARIAVGVHEGAMLVPKTALLRNDETNTYSVVVAGSDSLSHTVAVEIGAASDSLQEVVSEHLATGMQVITDGQYGLADSTRVTLSR
jgi:multidrug efflux pump subunit AcrA (membrane-fusion protein)